MHMFNTHTRLKREQYRCTPTPMAKIMAICQFHSPYVTDAQVGRVAGQSKQTWLVLTALIFLNCWFLSFVGMQILPFPAAVKVPSFRRFPEVLYDMILYDASLKGSKNICIVRMIFCRLLFRFLILESFQKYFIEICYFDCVARRRRVFL